MILLRWVAMAMWRWLLTWLVALIGTLVNWGLCPTALRWLSELRGWCMSEGSRLLVGVVGLRMERDLLVYDWWVIAMIHRICNRSMGMRVIELVCCVRLHLDHGLGLYGHCFLHKLFVMR